MKKSDPSSHVADQASLSKAQAGDVVDAVFSAIADASDTAPPSDNEPPRGIPETVLCESRGQGRVFELVIVRRFGLGRWAVPDRLEDPSVVEPIDPVECCELHRL